MTDTLVPPAPAATPPPRPRRVASTLGLAVVIVAAVMAFDPAGVRERLLGSATAPARPAAVSRQAGTGAGPVVDAAPKGGTTTLRSQPWWQGVATVEGTGSTTAQLSVDVGTLQWRGEWTCDAGHLVIAVPGSRRPLVDSQCPAAGTGYSVQKGAVRLDVTASSGWRVHVDQQVDVPLDEPPLPAMSAPGSSTVATGGFYRIDQFGDGRVSLHHLADGSWALRLEGFYVTPNTDLEVQLHPSPAPRTTQQVAASPGVTVAALDVTAGSMNVAVPAGIDPTLFHSVVIWCDREFSAYAAASLTAP